MYSEEDLGASFATVQHVLLRWRGQLLTLLLCIGLATERRNAIEQTRRRGSDDEDESGEEEESEEELPPIVERKRLSELEAEEEEEEEKEESKQSGPAAVIGTANPNRDRKQGKMMKTKDIAKLAEDPDAGPRLSRRERCKTECFMR